MAEIYKNIPITKEAYDLLCCALDNSDASNVSEVLIGQHNLIQQLIAKHEKMKAVIEALTMENLRLKK